jgi:hypothetical protein
MPTDTLIAVLVCFQVKHFVADYLLQTSWILRGKGDMHSPGGYAHAGLHAIGSLPVLAIAGLGLIPIIVLAAAEFVVHYVIDFGKAKLSAQTHCGPTTRLYWAMHGGDQMLHQLTYVAMLYAAIRLTAAP